MSRVGITFRLGEQLSRRFSTAVFLLRGDGATPPTGSVRGALPSLLGPPFAPCALLFSLSLFRDPSEPIEELR